MVNRIVMTLSRAKILVFILIVISALLGIIPALSSVVILNYHHNGLQNRTHSNPENLSNSLSIDLESFTNSFCTIDSNAEHTKFGNLVWPFKFFYDLIYAMSVLIITLLYILIYKEIYIRRRIKRNRKKEILARGSLILSNENNNLNTATSLKKKNGFYNFRQETTNLLKESEKNSLNECCGLKKTEKQGRILYLNFSKIFIFLFFL
jgi:hypothetical protein